ncbi:hypothetical protein D3C86_1643620 [compost metagenome]
MLVKIFCLALLTISGLRRPVTLRTMALAVSWTPERSMASLSGVLSIRRLIPSKRLSSGVVGDAGCGTGRGGRGPEVLVGVLPSGAVLLAPMTRPGAWVGSDLGSVARSIILGGEKETAGPLGLGALAASGLAPLAPFFPFFSAFGAGGASTGSPSRTRASPASWAELGKRKSCRKYLPAVSLSP